LEICERTNEVQPDPAVTKHISAGSVHLDALRGAAAFLVFLNHTRALYFSSALSGYDVNASEVARPSTTVQTQSLGNADLGMYEMLHGEIKLASEAVVIFFVLSGYLVGGSVLRAVRLGRWSWRSYLTKRMVRIYIVLLPALLLGVILDRIGLHHATPGSVYLTPSGIQLITTYELGERLRLLTVFGNALFLQDILVPYVGTNASIWSLANEVWYYIAFPFMVLASVKATKLWTRVTYVLIVVALLWFIGLRISLQFPVWIAGAALLYVPQKLSERQARSGVSASFLLLILTMGGVRLLHFRPISADYTLAIVTAVFLYFTIQVHAPAKRGVYKTVAGFASRISYSLYLFHLPIAVFLCSIVNNPWRPWAPTSPHIMSYLVTDGLIVVIVYFMWRVFEANTDAVRIRLFGK